MRPWWLLLLSLSLQAQERPAQIVELNQLLPKANYDIRYVGSNNFIGRPIAGYEAPKCLLHLDAAKALKRVAVKAAESGLRLKIFDCYRPKKAVADFMAWAADPNDNAKKASYYPNLEKSALIGDYIAPQSGHSRAATIDLTLEQQNSSGQWQELDMGGTYDLFDPVSNTLHHDVNPLQRENRLMLKALMEEQGFKAYPLEWWHFTLAQEPFAALYFDFPVR
ncbi:M15 family metallopeptidase [Aliiglaciecola sp. CAU 1673]|uniref:M15 family metallopeptidase n=1 Tax=Aliiglaciecola sp. CAU 1673 TaxID=3032595 RepID=UPI0023DC2D4F|nr:M15 family metallopeptidase [Aliiglaciecola sp. CAU 1673]MDF2177332.1 M15 family metallopeptidase [Aliiglaciecola sp. CAU 1673]